MIPELAELNQIRLDDDLSYDELAQQVGMDSSALYRLLNEEDRKPYDRTLHKIRRFLDHRQVATKPRRKAVNQ